jgi:hypothetical protein
MQKLFQSLDACNFPEIIKDTDVDFSGADGRRYKFSYASLGKILEIVKPVLKENSLRIIQMPCGRGLKTILAHKSGEYIESISEPSVNLTNLQDWGASITYLRRYAIICLLGIVAEDDQDGRQVGDSSTEKIGGKPRMDDSTMNKIMDYIDGGLIKDAQYEMNRYSMTFTQQDTLNRMINDKRSIAIKKSAK